MPVSAMCQQSRRSPSSILQFNANSSLRGQHNTFLGKQNPKNAMWAQFNKNLTTYEVPSELTAVIGGRLVQIPTRLASS
jgi:hypothetical protein